MRRFITIAGLLLATNAVAFQTPLSFNNATLTAQNMPPAISIPGLAQPASGYRCGKRANLWMTTRTPTSFPWLNKTFRIWTPACVEFRARVIGDRVHWTRMDNGRSGIQSTVAFGKRFPSRTKVQADWGERDIIRRWAWGQRPWTSQSGWTVGRMYLMGCITPETVLSECGPLVRAYDWQAMADRK